MRLEEERTFAIRFLDYGKFKRDSDATARQHYCCTNNMRLMLIENSMMYRRLEVETKVRLAQE